MNPAAVHTLLRLPPDPVVYRVEARNVGWPESWSDEVWCYRVSLVNNYTVSRTL